jgi:uncharacterized protein
VTDESVMPARSLKPCPICAKPAVQAVRPFCSKRCADIDLNRWFTGAYAIPVVETEADESADDTPPRRNDSAEEG